jgi:hypothetical protein
MTDAKKDEVGYVFTFMANIADGMSLTINGNFPKGADAAAMNAETDKVKGVINRHRAQNEVRILESVILAKKQQRDNHALDYAQWTATHPTGSKNYDHTMAARLAKVQESFDDEVERGMLELEETRNRAK